jgi:hypothetical protein
VRHTEVDTEVVVFTDANTFLNKDAIINICRHYADKKVGAVAGEKRVHMEENADATAGEGFYWKYESKVKGLGFGTVFGSRRGRRIVQHTAAICIRALFRPIRYWMTL